MKKIWISLLVVLLIGFGFGFYVASIYYPSLKLPKTIEKNKKDKRKILFYRNPMNPSITSPVPKKDEMGMDYVPVYEGDQGESETPGTVKINPVIEQNIGVRLKKAFVTTLKKEIFSYGRVSYDEDKIFTVHPRFKGWIDDVLVSRKGEKVQRGQLLCSIYSPELLSTELDYLLAIKNSQILKDVELGTLNENSKMLLESAQKRLELFGVSKDEIKRLIRSKKAKTSLYLKSDVKGTVISLKARKGLYVTPMTELYKISDLSSVWVLADVYERDLTWISIGSSASVFLDNTDQELNGTVEFIYPYENKDRRTVQVRMRFVNKNNKLKPGMFVNVRLCSKGKKALVVPQEAIIDTGVRKVAFVQIGKGRFEPREVKTGLKAKGLVEVKEGIRPGEYVVVSAQFLIDSESKLREATLKMISPSNSKLNHKMGKDGNMKDMIMDSKNKDKGQAHDKGHN